ncbi:SLOW GREEN 1 protein [Nymphaea thermarum]|nr:SLOW GREEN 1 protein [Nymphaea thermarum]
MHLSTSLPNHKALHHLPLSPFLPSNFPFQQPTLISTTPRFSTALTVSARRNTTPRISPILRTAGTAVLTTALLFGRFSHAPAQADAPPTPLHPPSSAEEETEAQRPVLEQFLESHPESSTHLRALVQQKLEAGEDAEALSVLQSLIRSQPRESEWKFLAARLLNEMGRPEESRALFEEILAENPLSFEALFENSILMDRCGEGKAALERLESALSAAKSEAKEKEARDVRFIIAQILFLQKKVEESLASYRELAKEDPKDFRPYFCQGVIYSLLDRNAEAKEQFRKYKELAPRKFEVEGYLQTPLSRMKIFGSDDSTPGKVSEPAAAVAER